MTVSKIRLPDNTEHDIRAKYLIQSTSADAVSAEFSARAVTDDAIANIQKIYGNTVVVSNNLVSNSATAILSRGFNQWDEEWEQGNIANLTGQNDTNGTNRIRSKNYISVTPSGSYNVTNKSSVNVYIYYYASDKSFISAETSNYVSGNSNKIYTLPSNCYFIRFRTYDGYGTTYANNICINISDTSKNGTYEPYNGHQIDLNIPTLTGKLNGTGSSVVIFPDGLKKAGTVYDEIVGNKAIKRVGSIDLGTLDESSIASYYGAGGQYQFKISDKKETADAGLVSNNYAYSSSRVANPCMTNLVGYTGNLYIGDDILKNKTAAQIKVLLSGTIVYYELATPQEYILDNALQLQYPVVAGGTEMVLPTSGTAPMKMDVIYGNAADAAATMSQNYISVDSMKEFLAALGTQMGGTWSMGYENGKHTFTFTSN